MPRSYGGRGARESRRIPTLWAARRRHRLDLPLRARRGPYSAPEPEGQAELLPVDLLDPDCAAGRSVLARAAGDGEVVRLRLDLSGSPGSSRVAPRRTARPSSSANSGFPPDSSRSRRSRGRDSTRSSRSLTSRCTAPKLSGPTRRRRSRSPGSARSRSSGAGVASSSLRASRKASASPPRRRNANSRTNADERSSHWMSSTATATGPVCASTRSAPQERQRDRPLIRRRAIRFTDEQRDRKRVGLRGREDAQNLLDARPRGGPRAPRRRVAPPTRTGCTRARGTSVQTPVRRHAARASSCRYRPLPPAARRRASSVGRSRKSLSAAISTSRPTTSRSDESMRARAAAYERSATRCHRGW